jgi:hypothetical protein
MIFGVAGTEGAGSGIRDTASGGFPPMPFREVKRPHLIDTISGYFSEKYPVVFVEGEDGCGATTLLAQFCMAVETPCFHAFVRPHSRFAYSVPYLRLMLAEQFCAYLGRDLPADSIVDDREYNALLLAVRKRKGRGVLHFVVDGLHQVPKEDTRQIKEIFTDVLSLGVDGFRFLITGRQEVFEEMLPGVRSKTYPVQRLSHMESSRFLEELTLTNDEAEGLIALCKGLPGRLASVRRQVSSGGSAKSILAADAKNYPQFLAMELKSLDDLDLTERTMLAVVVFSRYTVSRSELVELCGATEVNAKKIESSCSFVKLRDELPYSAFESEAHRRLAEGRLEALRNKALGLQIAKLSEDPHSPEAIQFLPAYLHQANHLQTLIDMLSPEHYERLLDKTQSVSSLMARAALGAKSAQELKLAVEVFQFSLQRSIFSDVAQARGFQAQVAALVALGQPQMALEVASRAATKERRLQMLAEYARTMREAGAEVDKEVIATIRELAGAIDFFGSPDDAEQLAENIAFIDPDLAISILDRSQVPNGSKLQRDEALVKVSFAATISRAQDNGAIVEKTSSQVSNERLRTLISFVSCYLDGVSAIQISEIADPMKVERRIYFLRSILAGADGRKSSLDVLEYAIDQIVNETSYLPKIRDFIDFATPLGFEEVDLSRSSVLLRRMEEQIALVADDATSGDRMRLQVKLARAEMLINEAAARQRLVDCYLQVLEISSHETKVECLAVLLHALKDIDRSGVIEREERLCEVVSDDLVQSIDELLSLTASHFDVVRTTLAAITKFDISSAISVADRLNTQGARDSAYQHIVLTAVSSAHTNTAESEVLRAVGCISRSGLRDDCIVAAVEDSRTASVATQWFTVLLKLTRFTATPSGTCAASTSLLRVDSAELPGCVDEIVARMRSGVAAMTSPVDRVGALFRFSAAIARFDKKLALEFYEKAEQERSSSRIATGASEATMGRVMALVVRAARPLLRFDELNDDYLARVVRLCGLLPDTLTQAAHLCDLAVKAWCEQRVDLSRRIVQQHCRPMLEEFPKGGEAYSALATIIFPALFLSRGAQAFELLEGIEKRAKDDALHACCLILIRRVTSADPWSGDYSGCSISFEDAEDVVRLITEMRSDFAIFSAIKSLSDVLISRRTKQKISVQQRLSIRQKLSAVVKSHLPDFDNIKHDGYAIVCEAHLGQLSDNPLEYWQHLRERAEALQNVADRVLVFLEIALCLPSRLAGEKRILFELSKSGIAQIPSAYDRYGRLNHLIDCARETEPSMARGAVRDALQITFELDNEAAAVKSRRQLLDIAEQIDPKLVDGLIDAVDDDPARAEAKGELISQSKVQKARRRISDARGVVEKDDRSEEVLPSAAWKTVGALVSGRSEPQIAERLTEHVAASGDWDLHSAFPVLSWYIENLGRRVMRAEDARAKVAPIWEALVLSAELAVNVISKDSMRQKRLLFSAGSSDDGLLVGRSEGREGALEFLRLWLRDNGGAGDGLILCDPYFGTGDMEFVRLVLGECPTQRLTILTSKKSVGAAGSDDFSSAWSDMVDQDPPDVEIIAMSDIGDDRSPVHDRWLLGESAGLRLGTSIGGYGGRLSEISTLDRSRLDDLRRRLHPFVNRERIVDGKRVNYATYIL